MSHLDSHVFAHVWVFVFVTFLFIDKVHKKKLKINIKKRKAIKARKSLYIF